MLQDTGIQMEIRLQAASMLHLRCWSQQSLMSGTFTRPSTSYKPYWQPELVEFQTAYRSQLSSGEKSGLLGPPSNSHTAKFKVHMGYLPGQVAGHTGEDPWVYSEPTAMAFCTSWGASRGGGSARRRRMGEQPGQSPRFTSVFAQSCKHGQNILNLFCFLWLHSFSFH